MSRPYVVAVWFLFTSWSAFAASFTPGNVVVYRVGDGTSALTASPAPVFLEEHDAATGALIQTIAMPSGLPFPLTATGTALTEGLLTRSADGAYLVLTGYRGGSAADSSARAIGRVASDGTYDTTTGITNAFSGTNIRSAASLDGWEFWATGGASGVQYAVLGASTSTTISNTVTDLRAAAIFDGQLYVSSKFSSVPLGAVGTGVPTTTCTTVPLPGYPTTNAAPNQFFFADLDGKPGVDTLYVADDSLGIAKYSLVSGSWTANGAISVGARGLTGRVSSSGVTLYFTAGPSQNELATLTDTSGFNATITGTAVTLATSPANTQYRGVAFAPGPPPAAPTTVVATATGATTVGISWSAVAGAVGYDVFRTGAGSSTTRIASVPSTSYVDSTASADTSYLYFVRAFDATALRSANSPADLATTVLFHDDPLVPGSTIVQAAHILDLRTAVNAVRALANLTGATFTDSTLADVPVKKVHIDELRTALDQARSSLALPAIAYGETIVSGTTTIKASHVTELRNGVK